MPHTGSSAEKVLYSTKDCSGAAESTDVLASSGDFGGCLLDNGVYYSAACGDYSASAISSSISEEAAFVYEYAQAAGAESKCKDSDTATAVKGYAINYCFGDDGPYSYKCSQRTYLRVTNHSE